MLQANVTFSIETTQKHLRAGNKKEGFCGKNSLLLVECKSLPAHLLTLFVCAIVLGPSIWSQIKPKPCGARTSIKRAKNQGLRYFVKVLVRN